MPIFIRTYRWTLSLSSDDINKEKITSIQKLTAKNMIYFIKTNMEMNFKHTKKQIIVRLYKNIYD